MTENLTKKTTKYLNQQETLTPMEIQPEPSRAYKDRLFRMIFKEKGEALKLYNAINQTDYQNLDDLTVTTLENAIYLGMKNDVSFVLYDILSLYEHQSTKNPNMCLRNLFYVSDVYSKLTAGENLFGSALIQIPEPRFIVFYNGTEEIPERSEMKLSSMFKTDTADPALELKTQVYNINLGCNRKLMESCKSLHEYAIFVNTVRTYQIDMGFKEAIQKAVDWCIKEGILADFLKKNEAEVISMGLYEYDEEKFIKAERKYAEEQGWARGRLEEKVRLVCKKLAKCLNVTDIADMLEETVTAIQNICDVAVKYQPDYDIDKIMEELLEKQTAKP